MVEGKVRHETGDYEFQLARRLQENVVHYSLDKILTCTELNSIKKESI